MTQFGAAARLASWAGQCPGQHESAGRKRPGRTRKGPKWLDVYLHDAALAAIRAKNSYLSAQYARLKGRRGHRKALKAVQHSLIVAVYHMLDRDQPYHDLGADYFRTHDPEQQARRLIRQLERLGYHVAAEPLAA
ncbi:MAG TPA: transposase [Pseudonocardiaceae bacterium]|nr:transposase [Pseudonocardiaceae bacterium]